MKTAALVFLAIGTYMLGAIAAAAAAPYEIVSGLGGTQQVSWRFALIGPLQLVGSGFFALCAIVQAIVEIAETPHELGPVNMLRPVVVAFLLVVGSVALIGVAIWTTGRGGGIQPAATSGAPAIGYSQFLSDIQLGLVSTVDQTADTAVITLTDGTVATVTVPSATTNVLADAEAAAQTGGYPPPTVTVH